MSTPTPDGAGSEGNRVDDLERLTSYLDGTLGADERAALEAELAGDAALRSRLAALEQADHALEALEATPLPEGARHRLDARLADTLDEVLGPAAAASEADAPLAPTTAAASGRRGDELARRRDARRRPVVTATAGVAAGLVLLAGGVVGLGQLSPGADDEAAMQPADQVEEAAEDGDAQPAGVDDTLAADLPVVIDEGRTSDEEDAQRLLGDPQLQALAQRGLSVEEGAALAEDVQRRVLGAPGDGPSTLSEEDGDGEVTPDSEPAPQDDAGMDVEADEEARGTPGPAPAALLTRDGEQLAPAVAEDLRRCLAELLDPGEQAVPAAIELVTLDGGDAAIFGLLTLDPDTGAFSRIEAWTLALDTCQVLRFDQS